MRQLGTVVAALALSLTAACGSPQAPPIQPSATSSPGGGSTPTALPPSAAYPDSDVALSSAPPELAGKWARLGVTIIPSKRVVSSMPAPPTVVNHAGPAVSDAAAQQLAQAFNLEAALEQWADANRQIALRTHLVAPALNTGPEVVALAQGKAVIAPPCFFYFPVMTLVPVDPALSAYFAGIGQPITAKQVFRVETGGELCEVTARASDGSVSVIDRIPAHTTAVLAGVVVNDPVLGSFWKTEAATLCPIPSVGQGICSD